MLRLNVRLNGSKLGSLGLRWWRVIIIVVAIAKNSFEPFLRGLIMAACMPGAAIVCRWSSWIVAVPEGVVVGGTTLG